MPTVSLLCQYKNYSCFGCCGHSFQGKRKIMADIRKNTNELIQIQNKKDFRDRYPPDALRMSGICRQLTYLGKKKIGCPLHPALNKGRDLRDRCCDKNYLCETAFAFNKWPKKKQQAFLKFVDWKKLDNYAYSVGMDSGQLMKQFISPG